MVVITGKNASNIPRTVTQVKLGGKKILVEGVNLVYKHVKKGHPKSPQGGRLRMEMPIDTSNVLYFCETCKRGRRLGMQFTAAGVKERFCRKCRTVISQVGPVRKRVGVKTA